MARSHAPTGFPGFARYGDDVLVIWDEADETTDAYLHAALLLGLVLATRQKRGDDEGNIKALTGIESRIENELTRHEKVRSLAESIKHKAEEIEDEVRKGRKGLSVILRDAKATLRALNVEIAAPQDERDEPVALPASSLSQARAGIAAASGPSP